MATDGGRVLNLGVDYIKFNAHLSEGFNSQGIKIHLPLRLSNSERVVAAPMNATLINQSGVGLLSHDRPATMTYWGEGRDAPQFRMIWWSGKGWRSSTVSTFSTVFRLDGGGTLPLPHSRPAFVVAEDDTVILLYRSMEKGNRLIARFLSPPDYDLSRSTEQVIVDEDLGYYEPVINYSAWSQSQLLSVYYQYCDQGLGRDGRKDRSAAMANSATWKYLN